MASIRKKLNSQAGAAMVIALVFFLLCVMVGMVIVTAAFVSAGSVAQERETWRETEALTSAAQLLADDVKDMKFTGAYTKTETVTTTVTQTGETTVTETVTTTVTQTGETRVTEEGPALTPEDSSETGLSGSDLLKNNSDLITALYKAKTGIDALSDPEDARVSLNFAASAEGESGGSEELENVPDVTGTLTVSKEDYTITAVLTCGDSALTMVFEAEATESAGEAKQDIRTEKDGGASIAVKTVTTTYTTTITWGEPVITEGGTTS